jgi:hypothetical protein
MQLVNQVRLGETELSLSPACEKILKTTSQQCQLDEIQDLREGLLLVARHLSQAT